jgi:hypothetical protein
VKRSLPPYGHTDLRVLLSRIETELSLWSRGYEEIALRRLEQFLRSFQKAMTATTDLDDRKQLQHMMHQLESLHQALLRSEPVDHQFAQELARQIVENIHALRDARTSMLKPVAVEEAVGAHVIYFNSAFSTIGQIVRFRPAGREKRAFGFIGEVIIRPADEL